MLPLLLLSNRVFSQAGSVGIGTTTPKTTLDVNGRRDGAGNLLVTDPTGLQAPRVTRAELTAKGNVLYGTGQTGAIIFITDIAGGDNVGQRINIDASGYYYFDGSIWQKFNGGGSSNTGGSNPAATVLYTASNTVPAGYLECNGAAVSRTTYATLFAAIGTTYGTGDGATTFNLPDLRGEFVRGWDHGRGVDSGRSIGSWQKGSFQHFASGPNPESSVGYSVYPGSSTGRTDMGLDDLNYSFYPNSIASIPIDLSNPQGLAAVAVSPGPNPGDSVSGGSRPRNTALMPIIKY